MSNSSSSLEDLVKAGAGAQDAVDLGSGIYMSKGIANSYLVTTSAGDVLINTGLAPEAPEILARFGRVSHNPLRVIVFTQGHPDHVGGWSQFTAPDVETVAQANHADVREYWSRLLPYYSRRIMKLWGVFSDLTESFEAPPEPVVDTTFFDSHRFELGGRRLELYATPGGEATDGLVVWLPEDRTVLVGNLLGPMFGHVPNLYTIRGDKLRSAISFLHGVDRVIALEPDVLINGHERFSGAGEIRETLELVRDATAYLRDATIDAMNAGADLWTVMAQVTLPDKLAIPQLHGKVPWIVRSIFEEHAGWFRYESTTELYDVPAAAVWPDLLALAGGSAGFVSRSAEHVASGRPLHALQLLDIVLSAAPQDLDALGIKIEALQMLLERSGRENFSEVQWLEQEIAGARQQIADTGSTA